MAKSLAGAWFFLLVSFAGCAQLPVASLSVHAHQHRLLDGDNSTADVAEAPDEHVQERTEDASWRR